jgi:periplasmic protein TonB
MMKRNEKKIPKFDEIIFENRNKEYGAFVLRKSYKNITSFSVLSTVAFFTLILVLISLNDNTATGETGTDRIVLIQPEILNPLKVMPPEIKPPSELVKAPQNVKPIVVEDTAVKDFNLIPINEVLISTAVNGNPDDTVPYIEPPVELVPKEKQVFIVVEEPPAYPGGDVALLEYIGKNIHYPAEAIANNIEGRVFLKFVVTEDGSVGDIILLKGVDPLLDKEAIRVVGTIPDFKPGRQSGVAVQVWYTVPVLFLLKQ